MRQFIISILVLTASVVVIAGGNPEHVPFPEGYHKDFTLYDVRNRSNGKQLAKLYANDIALDSVNDGEMSEGSTIVMEVYKPKLDADGNPILGNDGLMVAGKFAAVAVMQKQAQWPDQFASNERAGDWGFALYQTDGKAKDNDLECATCHQPLEQQNFMFSHASLLDYFLQDK